jgi:hypothetical protein
MPSTYFTPHQPITLARAMGCYTGSHFRGRLMAQHIVCEHRGAIQVIGIPRNGCAYWKREPGSEDA